MINHYDLGNDPDSIKSLHRLNTVIVLIVDNI